MDSRLSEVLVLCAYMLDEPSKFIYVLQLLIAVTLLNFS